MLQWLLDLCKSFIKLTKHTDRKEKIKEAIEKALELSKSDYQTLFDAMKKALRNFEHLTLYDDQSKRYASFDVLPHIMVLKSLPCLLELYY